MEECTDHKVPLMEAENNLSNLGDEGIVCDLTNLKNVSCAIGSQSPSTEKSYLFPTKPKLVKTGTGNTGAVKPKRKSRSTRRRLNALTNNTSLHFSDTDSEGELILINPRANNVITSSNDGGARGLRNELPNPTISVTTDGVEGTDMVNVDPDKLEYVTPNRSRRQSFAENATDCDEVYSSDPEAPSAKVETPMSLGIVTDEGLLRETDCEDISNDEDDDPVFGRPIYVEPRSDLFVDFNGETITTKEGDGPFSIEVRNQISFDEGAVGPYPGEVESLPPVAQVHTDSEEMDASDDDNPNEGAERVFEEIFQDLDVAGTSQIVMKNLDKIEQESNNRRLSIATVNPDDGLTDVEDIDE